MPRILLVLPTATYRARDFLAAARALDVELIITSERRAAMSETMGDLALIVDLSRPEAAADAIVARAQDLPLDAVLAADEQGVLVAALASARLGLPHNPPQSVAATIDKIAMRRAFETAGIPQPDHRIAESGADVASLAGELGPPVVVKPVSLSASRGVIRADDPAAAGEAAERVRAILADAGEDPQEPLLVERYLPGTEVAVEGLMRGGALEILALFDKPDPLEGPYFEETIYVTPSRLPAETREAVEVLAGQAAAALGLVEGPIHAELRIDQGSVRMLELGARSIGGLCSRSLRFGTDASLEELILRHALGHSLEDLSHEAAASGVMMLPIPRAGTLKEVLGQEEARAVPGVTGLEISIAPGKVVRTLPEADRYLGFLFARGETPAAVERALRTAHERLEIVITDPPG